MCILCVRESVCVCVHFSVEVCESEHVWAYWTVRSRRKALNYLSSHLSGLCVCITEQSRLGCQGLTTSCFQPVPVWHPTPTPCGYCIVVFQYFVGVRLVEEALASVAPRHTLHATN